MPGKREGAVLEEPPAKVTKVDHLDLRAEKERLRLEEKAQKEAERLKAKQEREEKRLAEKARKEQERQEERQRKEAEREAKRKEREEEKSRKEAEREADKARKDAEREAEKARKDAEREAGKTRKEAEKAEEKNKKDLEKRREAESQLKINTFFKTKALPKPEPEPEPECDYEKCFLPFHLKARTKVHVAARPEPVSPENTGEWLKEQRFSPLTVDYLSPDELADSLISVTESQMPELLAQLDIRHLQFAENLRPPYVGTVSGADSENLAQLRLQSTERLLDLNYDYDSDFEWFQEEDDGEDLGDEDGSEEEDDEDDLDEFVTSDDDSRRMQVTGPLTPAVIWNNGDLNSLEKFTVEVLVALPIEPLKDYWSTPREKLEKDTDAPTTEAFPAETMKSLLLSIQGRKMNQTLLVELLKQDFPQVSKAAILATVKSSAKRLGGKEPDKKWVVNEDLCGKFDIPQVALEPVAP